MEVTVKSYKPNFVKVLQTLFKFQSLNRGIRDSCVAKLCQAQGKVIDIGGGSSTPYYWKMIRSSSNAEFVNVDINSSNSELRLDLEEELPFKTSYFDTVLCFSVLEHIYNYEKCLKEINRIKTKEGRAFFWIPFFMQPHGGEFFDDYFRFTDSALKSMFAKSHFESCDIIVSASPFWVIGNICSQSLGSRLLFRPIKLLLSTLFFVLGYVSHRDDEHKFPIGYFIIAR